jgi:hypothetical protein
VQDHIRLADFIQRGPEGDDEVRRQLADEAHCVRRDHPPAEGQREAVQGRIERREVLVLSGDAGAYQRMEQRRLARIV